MKAKTKLIATIMAMCLVVTLGVIGIFAVKTLNMNVGGNITFSADGLSLEVFDGEFKTTGGADYSNITTQESKLQGFVMNTDTKQSDIQSKIDSWANLELTLDSKGSAVLHFAVKNNMTTPLYVYIATELGTNTNNNMDILVSPNGTEIGAGLTTNFEITFDILDTSINAGLKGFNVAVTFAKESLVVAQNKIDQATGLETTEVDYYYVEMGTYNGEPVRWRYIADENGNPYNGENPTSIKGIYFLETYIPNQQAYLSSSKYSSSSGKHLENWCNNIFANDYGISDAREYLTNQGSDGFFNQIGLTKSDLLYSLINPRTVSDLYSNIESDAFGGQKITSENLEYSLSFVGDRNISMQKDKFWILSYKEVKNYLDNNHTIRKWGDGCHYWLRSPHSLGYTIYSINPNGSSVSATVSALNGVRPCFKIA